MDQAQLPRVRTGDPKAPAITSSPSSPPVLSSNPLASVPLWGRVLLGRVYQGIPLNDARALRGSKVSIQAVQRLGRLAPAWYGLLLDADLRAATECPVLSSELTRAHAWAEEERRHKLAMGEVDGRQVRDRDALTAMHLGAEIRRDIGAGSVQGPSPAPVVVRVAVAVGAPFRRPESELEPESPPAPALSESDDMLHKLTVPQTKDDAAPAEP